MKRRKFKGCPCSFCRYDAISTPDTGGEYDGIDAHMLRLEVELAAAEAARPRIAVPIDGALREARDVGLEDAAGLVDHLVFLAEQEERKTTLLRKIAADIRALKER